MSAGAVRKDEGDEAWALVMKVFMANRSRFWSVAQEFDLAPMQAHALRILEPGRTVPMNALADELHCDNSNVTGIVDRLEARGLIERRSAPEDRRKKLLAITADGERVREQVLTRMFRAPDAIAALSREDKRLLRDVMRRAAAHYE